MVTSRDFEVRRGRTAPYEVYKPSDAAPGLPVLFLHGWRSSPAMFHDLIACLDHGGIRCILPHLTSDDTRGQSTASRSAHLPALGLIDELRIDCLGIVAFGMFGGCIARNLIRELGYQRFAFVSLLSPGPCLIDTPAREAFWNMLPAETRAKVLDLPPSALEAMVRKAVDLFDVQGSAASRDAMFADLHSMAEEIIALAGAARKKHQACSVPVEVVCGELDEVIPLELSFKTVRDFGEVHVSVIPLAGHHFVAEFYEETARCMREFLDERVKRISCSQRALP